MYTARLEGAFRHPESNEWVRRLVKVGYAVKGVVYGLVAILALQVAASGSGKPAGEHEAVEHVRHMPFGTFGLIVIGVGLAGYALFRLLEGVLDLKRVGSGAKGIGKRIGYVGSGVINAGVAITAFQLASGGHARDDKTWVSELMREPGGLVVLGLIGVGLLIAGIVQIYVGYTRKFLEEVRVNEAPPQVRRWLVPFGRIGHAARGVVFLICGAGLVRAALETNPRQARSFGEALGEIAAQPFGQVLLALMALGLLAYGSFLLATAKYRKLAHV